MIRRDIATEILRSHNLLACIPQGVFNILIDISRSRQESYAFSKELQNYQVAVTSGRPLVINQRIISRYRVDPRKAG
jgi:hypothetical protein